jgi:hypothetical protein
MQRSTIRSTIGLPILGADKIGWGQTKSKLFVDAEFGIEIYDREYVGSWRVC